MFDSNLYELAQEYRIASTIVRKHSGRCFRSSGVLGREMRVVFNGDRDSV